jgi:hypothetical protein
MTQRRAAGDFSSFVAVDDFDFHVGDFDEDRLIHGMGQRVIWPYGALLGESGALYVLERKFVHQMTGGLWIMTKKDGALELVPSAVYSARGEVRRERTADRLIFRDHLMAKLGNHSPAEEQSFLMEVADDEFLWQEGSLLDVRGRGLGTGLQFFFLDQAMPVGYFSRAYWMSGTALGERVEGICGFEHCYWTGRGEWKEMPFYADRQIAWSLFCNRYDDGEIEWGHVVCGRDGTGALLISDNTKKVLTTSQFERSFAMDDQDYIRSARYRADDQEWEFLADTDGMMTQFNKARWGGYRAQSGVLRKVGDTRVPNYSFTWIEAFADRIREEGLVKA